MRYRKSGKVIFKIILLAGLLVLTACGSDRQEGGKTKEPKTKEPESGAQPVAETGAQAQSTDGAAPPEDEREEVVLADSFVPSCVQKAILDFNRKNEKYRVVIQESPEDSVQGFTRFRENIQLQLSAGKGPDILSSGVLWDYKSAAEKGFLEKLDSVAEGDADLLDSAMQSGVLNGVRYGLPVRYNLMFLTGSSDLVGNRSAWDTREMMRAVRASGADYLCCDYGRLFNGWDIVYKFGLSDNDDPTYIDWEAGVSHLTEAPFIELLEFAKEYAGKPQDMDATETGPALQEGRVALTYFQLLALDYIQSLEEIFAEKEVYIGYPCVKGSGVYLLTFDFYLNAASEHKEGAEEFLRYLLTEEGQRILTDRSNSGSGFPVRRSVLEANVRLAQTSPEGLGYYDGKMDNVEVDSMGIVYRPHLLTEERGDRFLALVERAEPYDWNVGRIDDILSEELELYFKGERTAQETARVLDNRVQLYLNER